MMKRESGWKKKVLGVVMAAIITVMFGLAMPACAAEKLVIEGSTTVLPIAQRAAEEFMKLNPDLNISVRGGGSGVGIASLIAGTCDIADSSREIKTAEIQKAQAKGRNPRGTVIAMDGIVVIVNPANPVRELSIKQIQDIYTGKVTDWSRAGGNKGKIVVVSRDSASGTFEAFGELALKGAKVASSALLQASNQAVAGTVARTPGGIGYVGMGYVFSSVKGIPIDGKTASKESVLNSKYPLSRPLFMYTDGRPKGAAKRFLDYLLSETGQKLVEEDGFVGLK